MRHLLANILFCHHETKWLNDCPIKLTPVFYKRYVDDIFVLFKSPDHVTPFVDYMNSKHKNINISFETEKDGQMPFLDVDLFRENGKFVTDVNRKKTFAGIYTNFSSFIPLDHKYGLVHTFVNLCIFVSTSLISLTLKLKNLRRYFYLTDIPTNS